MPFGGFYVPKNLPKSIALGVLVCLLFFSCLYFLCVHKNGPFIPIGLKGESPGTSHREKSWKEKHEKQQSTNDTLRSKTFKNTKVEKHVEIQTENGEIHSSAGCGGTLWDALRKCLCGCESRLAQVFFGFFLRFFEAFLRCFYGFSMVSLCISMVFLWFSMVFLCFSTVFLWFLFVFLFFLWFFYGFLCSFPQVFQRFSMVF